MGRFYLLVVFFLKFSVNNTVKKYVTGVVQEESKHLDIWNERVQVKGKDWKGIMSEKVDSSGALSGTRQSLQKSSD